MPAPKNLLELGMHRHRALFGVAALGCLQRLIVVLSVDAQRAERLDVGHPVPPAPAAGFADPHPGEELKRKDDPAVPPDPRVGD
ncbi:MAG: hypothetical protein OES69_08870 [Myxococcales bacterium]|nr:hypothetical protein [Myxococcales bacterium]